MSAVVRYALVSIVVVGAVAAVLFALLDGAGRTGALLAAVIALPIQVVAFAFLARAKGDVTAFFLWWGAGIAMRVIVVATG